MSKRDWRVLIGQGIGHLNRNDCAAAADAFEAAIALGAATPAIRCLFARALHRSGRTERAITEFKNLIDAAPDCAPAREGLTEILRSGGCADAESRTPHENPLFRGNKVSVLDESVFSVQDVIPLLLGDKPAAYNDATKEQSAFVASWARRTGLHAANIGKVKTPPQQDKKERYGVLLSKNPRLLAKAVKLWRSHSESRMVGRLLGYPECCVSAHEIFYHHLASNPQADAVRFIAAASGAGPYSFLLNNTLVFNSRRCGAADGEGVERLFRLNADPNISLKLKAMISWHPCSYRCPRSLAAARRIWSFLERFSPVEAAALKGRLEKPLLFLDWSTFAAFEGRADRKRLVYSRVVPPYSFLSSGHLALIASGNNLRLLPGGVGVRRDAKALSVLHAASPLLLPFSSRTS
jgi:hypothetical protein